MKVLFYGGAFNPVTKAHVELANYVRKKLRFDAVLFVPTKDKYIKHDEGKDFVFSGLKRKQLLDDVAKSNDWMIVSDYELNLEEQPRTYTTLCHFRDEGYELKLLIGSDWLPKLKTGWKFVEEISKEFGFVCMTRNHDDIEKMITEDDYLSTLKDYIICVNTPETFQNISSSKIRALYLDILDKEDEMKKMLPKEIEDTFMLEVKGEIHE